METQEDASGTQAWVDGNAAAGILASLFVMDATRARIVCAGCGNAAAVAEQRAFAMELGAVLRCPSCADVTLRIAVTRHGCFIDMRGAQVVQFA